MTRPTTILAVALVAACGGDLIEPAVTTLELRTVTTGTALDPDGYALRLDGGPSTAIGLNATQSMSDVSAGEHRVVLEGVASNCVLDGSAARAVTVLSGTIARVRFDVACGTPQGIVAVSVVTTGALPDPDGYVVLLDGTGGVPVASSGTVTFPSVPEGDHEIQLSGVASNCAVGGGPSRTVALLSGTTFGVVFEVTCIGIADGLVLFSSNRNGASHLYRIKDDGTGLKNLTPGVEAFSGDWSPDGTRIVFATPAGLFVMNSDGSSPAALGVEGADPRWSPDGQRILFNAGGMMSVMGTDGTGVTPLAEGGGATWSPDGTRIAFARVDRSRCVADLFCPSDIYTMNPDGSRLTRLISSANASDQLGAPAWSPDGGHIAYIRSCCFLGPSTSGLYVTTAGGGQGQRVFAGGVGGRAVWSPDSRALVIPASQPDGTTDLTLIPSTGGSSGIVLAASSASEYPRAWR